MVSLNFFKREAVVKAGTTPFRDKEQARLVRRLDMYLMTFGCISQGA